MLATRAMLTGAAPDAAPRPTGPYLIGAPHGTAVLTQFHCHTTQSDGTHTPAQIVAYYAAAGYGALVITDHDMVTEQPAGITTAIPGNEVSPTEQHIVSLDSDYTRGEGVTDAQTIIDGIVSAGGQAVISHPNLLDPGLDVGITVVEMAALTDWLGMEIHNAGVVIGALAPVATTDGFAVAEWDDLLADRTDIWSFSIDDLHTVGNGLTYDIGRCFVFCDSNTKANIMAATIAGNFVADVGNHGVTPGFPARSATGVQLTCAGATRIEAYGASGLLASSAGESIDYTYGEGIGYCRLVAVGDYTEPFSSALSDRWQVVDGTWAVSGGILSHSGAGTNRLMLMRQREGDFTAQVDMRMSGSSDLVGLMTNVRVVGGYYYLVQLSAAKLSLSRVQGGSTISVAADETVTHDVDTWYTVKVDYTAGAWRIKSWAVGGEEPDWMASAEDTTWSNGAFGLRAYGTPDFDNLYIDGFRTYYQPIPV